MFDLSSLDRAEKALAETTGRPALKVIPQAGAVRPVTGQRGEMPLNQPKREGVCPIAHGEHHG
jgi:hypothetical protein